MYFRAEKKERSRLKTVRVTRSQDRSVSGQENNVDFAVQNVAEMILSMQVDKEFVKPW